MKTSFISFSVGVLFAIGLGLSGMTQPEKVIGFLDIFGQWDPSLMFVMLGAIGVHMLCYQLIRRKEKPIFEDVWHIPKNSKITKSLALGAMLFGIGWGLAGYCPGPALASALTLNKNVLIFLPSMMFGMLLFKIYLRFVKSK